MALRPRIAARAVIVRDARLLLVNAYPDGRSDLWCAPGGGVEAGTSLPETLKREVHEETGLHIAVHAPCLVNEFHDPNSTFHQIDIYFRASISAGQLDASWQDPEGIVTHRHFFSQTQMRDIRYKPDSLLQVAFNEKSTLLYDPLEPIVR